MTLHSPQKISDKGESSNLSYSEMICCSVIGIGDFELELISGPNDTEQSIGKGKPIQKKLRAKQKITELNN